MKWWLGLVAVLAGLWLWNATEPEKTVGRVEFKIEGWHQIWKLDVFNRTIRLNYMTYKLGLVDVWAQRLDVDVSKSDFEAAKFNERGAWNVARIRKHYRIEMK